MNNKFSGYYQNISSLAKPQTDNLMHWKMTFESIF